jgi:chitinase
LGKTILLSIGGATYTEGGFSSASAAQTAAQTVWNLFGTPTSSANRPFGTAIVDGFDFDFESTTQNMAPFAQELRNLMDASGTKKFYLSAAPQCPYPDAADNDMLNDAVSFDFIQVQFYNNYCGVSSYIAGASTQNNFNFATWDTWAKTVSANPNVKVLLGVPANTGAGGGYVSASTLTPITAYCKQFSSFGGVSK